MPQPEVGNDIRIWRSLFDELFDFGEVCVVNSVWGKRATGHILGEPRLK